MGSRFSCSPPTTSQPLNPSLNEEALFTLQNRPSPVSVKNFLAYQIRIPLTAGCLLSGLILTLLSYPRIPAGSRIDSILIAAGYGLVMSGIFIRLWSINHIHTRKTVAIVSTGPYALCRNPLYVGTLLTILGYLLLVQSLTLALFCLPVIFLYHWGVVPAEEAVMRSRHGRPYEDYCRQVHRWRPRWNPAVLEGRMISWCAGIRRELECAGWWILIALLVRMVCSYRQAAWWVHPLILP